MDLKDNPNLTPEQQAEIAKNLQAILDAAEADRKQAPARPNPGLDPLVIFRKINAGGVSDADKYAAIRAMVNASRQQKVHEVSKAQMWRVIAWLLDHGPQRGRGPRLADAVTGKN